MERQIRIRIKKIAISAVALVCLTGKAQTMPDSVIMIVGDKHVPLSEFVYLARKNNEVNFSDKQSVDKYVEMFKNFKLKVLDAESQGLDTTSIFKQELEMYKAQLIADYMSDRKGEEDAARAIYERESEYIVLSHILIPFTKEQCVTKDTIRLYKKAVEIYNRICNGEDFDTLGIRLLEDTQSRQRHLIPGVETDDSIAVRYEYVPRFLPMQKSNFFEDVAYSTSVGKISFPVRTSDGYSIIKVKARQPNFGYIQLAYLNIPYIVDSVTRSKDMIEKLAKEAYTKASSGEDFITLVNTYSVDTVGGGILPKYVPGQLRPFFEDAVCALVNPDDITPPLFSEEGVYIFKLMERQSRPSFGEVKDDIISDMRKTELNFDLYKAFDDYLKKEYNYTFYPDAYAELEELCDEYFPSSNDFWAKARDMDKTLILINGEDFPQKEFAHYMQRKPFSAKTYSKDFMREVFALFVRDIATTYERNNLEIKHPEVSHLIQEYRDGILLFELSNERVWTQPAEEQVVLEEKWVEELNEKYPVTVNSKLLEKLIKEKQR
jgi:peptidyl-prolyl cis-trans isomerase SurA